MMFRIQSPRQVQGDEMSMGMGYETPFRPPKVDAKFGEGQGLRRWLFGDVGVTDWGANEHE